MDMFTDPKLGRLVTSKIIETFPNVLRPDFCANECLRLPNCLSFNYDYGMSGTCEILEELERTDVEIHEVGRAVSSETCV